MSDLDQEIVEAARENGVGIAHNLLTEKELSLGREAFDQVYLDLDKGPGEPGTRDSIWGEELLKSAALERLFSHPHIISIISGILDELRPFLQKMKTNRYTPFHPGVGRHTDGKLGELSPPFSMVSTQVFLDDIEIDSGALAYVPRSHILHYESAENLDHQPPTKEQIRVGNYVPAELKAGSVIFRLPEVWHAVNPIHRLRRYVTGTYTSRDRFSASMTENVDNVVQSRKQIPIDSIPSTLHQFWQF
ncbi:TPA: hypothetical protein EYN98_20225 [Candidatus Poribacteria bacterium]|jgi:hypothetical protein|nr:hypothetical protein [Candidatus Poribacteria bacterium]HIA68329.1 hypothetical protein [Candidatus Poribacteria bacterium]HIB87176.1 hypothetical protein [Candidatus Poribacteria bacterium]HIB99657.1 hypothetical protein [Candidatus Poribacteria bacterium]HIM11800.1 hypothetical protein [Candidatus Poribacteria bacterium]